MASHTVIPAVREPEPKSRPMIASYDTGHEHSVEHLLELQDHVEQAAKERPVTRKRIAMMKV